MAASSVTDTREAILRSALELFSHKGYVGATIGGIAKNARVNTLTVFRHFQGKENLFRETIMRYADIDIDTGNLDRLVSGKTLLDGLSLLSCAYFEIMFRNIHIFRIFIIEATHFPWVGRMSWRMPPRLHRYLQGFLAEMTPGGHNGEERMRLLTDMFLAHITRLTLQFNKHDGIWIYSEELLDAFSLKMRPQIEFFANAMLAENLGGRVSARRRAPAEHAAARKEIA